MSTPIDATATGAWTALTAHRDGLTPDLRAWFDADPERATRLSRQVGDLHVDLSKNLITDETLELLTRLADEVDLSGRLAAMFA
ncbi:glucose-6-phosphate isomerase, partial [Bacillus licheniformis]